MKYKVIHSGIRAKYAIAAFVLTASLLASCNIFGPDDSEARKVSFGGRTMISFPTKTEYSGKTINGIERVNWVEGDTITVVSPDATVYDKSVRPWLLQKNSRSAGATANDYSSVIYEITDDIAPDNSRPFLSNATLMNINDGNGLLWDQIGPPITTYRFYGMYPAGKPIVWDSSDKAVLGPSIPKSQSCRTENAISKIDGTDTTRVWPDMQIAYMYAAAKVKLSNITVMPNVILDFYPMVTSFQLKINAVADKEVWIDRIDLASASCALSGSYVAEVTIVSSGGNSPSGSLVAYPTSGYPVYAAGVNDTVSFQLPRDPSGKPAVKVTADDYAIVTLFTLPKGRRYSSGAQIGDSPGASTITDLTLLFYTVIDEVKMGRSLALKPKTGTNPSGVTLSANGYVEFPAGKKIHIEGLTLPDQKYPWRFSVEASDLDPEQPNVPISPVLVEPVEPVNGGKLD